MRERTREQKTNDEAERKAAEITYSLLCDFIAHDPPNGDATDTALRSLAAELKGRSEISTRAEA